MRIYICSVIYVCHICTYVIYMSYMSIIYICSVCQSCIHAQWTVEQSHALSVNVKTLPQQKWPPPKLKGYILQQIFNKYHQISSATNIYIIIKYLPSFKKGELQVGLRMILNFPKPQVSCIHGHMRYELEKGLGAV